MSAPARVAILAALPREVHQLVHGVSPDPLQQREGVFLYRLGAAVVVAAGMGSTRVSRAFAAAMAEGRVEEVISVGLAGGCTAAIAAGTTVEARLVVDARTGERFRTAHSGGDHILATTETIAGVTEKARLAATYGAGIVDMEGATVARLAAAQGLRFRAVKGISDAHDFELASLAQFTGRHGHFRTAAFALHTALRPHHWRTAATLGRESNRALSALHECLEQILDEVA